MFFQCGMKWKVIFCILIKMRGFFLYIQCILSWFEVASNSQVLDSFSVFVKCLTIGIMWSKIIVIISNFLVMFITILVIHSCLISSFSFFLLFYIFLIFSKALLEYEILLLYIYSFICAFLYFLSFFSLSFFFRFLFFSDEKNAFHLIV